MRRLGSILVFVLLLVAMAFRVHADDSFLKAYERRPLPSITPPHVRVETLANGMRLFLLEDKTLPIVKVRVITRTGRIADPSPKVGLAQLTGMVMRSGGTKSLSPDAFDTAVDELGANLSSSIGLDMGQASLEVLSDDMAAGLDLLFEMIFQPRFDPGRMRGARLKIEEAQRRIEDDPGQLAAVRFRELVYGTQSPWARRPNSATLKRIRREDLRAFHERFYRTDNMILAAAGNFDADAFIALIRERTAGAPGGAVVQPEITPVELVFEAETERIVRSISQGFIRIGHLGIKRHNPDKFALLIAVDILGGGGFKSRLMEDIRTKRGLAYSIFSALHPGTDYGLFTVGVTTTAAQIDKVVGLVREHIERLTEEKVSDEELALAKQSQLASMVFAFDSAFKVANHQATYFYYGYPEDYWKVYRDEIARVTRQDVYRVARKYLHPDGLKSVIVGPRGKGR